MIPYIIREGEKNVNGGGGLPPVRKIFSNIRNTLKHKNNYDIAKLCFVKFVCDHSDMHNKKTHFHQGKRDKNMNH